MELILVFMAFLGNPNGAIGKSIKLITSFVISGMICNEKKVVTMNIDLAN